MQDQEIYFLKTFQIAIKKMNKKLKYVSDIMFSYFRSQKCGDVGNGDYLGGKIQYKKTVEFLIKHMCRI